MVNFAQFKVYKSRTRTRARAPSILSLSAFRLPIQRSKFIAIIVVGFNNLCIQLSIQKFKYPFLNPKLYIGTLFSTFFSAFLNNETERATPEDKEKSKTKINISSFLK
jgi:hypothetical protein